MEPQALATASSEGRGADWLRPLRNVRSFLKGGLLERLPWVKPKLPVTVLSGFLGSGKTTLLKHILRSAGEGGQAAMNGRPLRVAVIVNDMGEVNLDASEIKNSRLIQQEATMVEMSNGCICCTLRGDLLRTVRELSEERAFDYLVIESTGISEPLPVAQTFTMDVDELDVVEADDRANDAGPATTDGEGASPSGVEADAGAEANASASAPGGAVVAQVKSLSHFARLDTMVTVVDALNIYDVLGSLETLAGDNITGMLGNGGESAEEQDMRGIAQLMLDQIEFANVILLSKADLVTREGALEEIRALLQRLNPLAQVIVPQPHFEDLPLSTVINTRLFDMDAAEESAGWQHELAKHDEGGEGHTPETEEYGISSAFFRNNERPFHPGRLEALLSGFGNYGSADNGWAATGAFGGVVRAKGDLWMATAHACPVLLHAAGRHVQLQVIHPFLAAMSPCCWSDEDRELHQEMEATGYWHPEHGDRGSSLIFIGVGLQREAILARLEAALLTDEEMRGGPESWKDLEDNFFGGAHFVANPDMDEQTVVLTE